MKSIILPDGSELFPEQIGKLVCVVGKGVICFDADGHCIAWIKVVHLFCQIQVMEILREHWSGVPGLEHPDWSFLTPASLRPLRLKKMALVPRSFKHNFRTLTVIDPTRFANSTKIN